MLHLAFDTPLAGLCCIADKARSAVADLHDKRRSLCLVRASNPLFVSETPYLSCCSYIHRSLCISAPY